MRGHTRIVVTQGVTALISVAALIASLTTISTRIDDIQQSRYKASYASCTLLAGVIHVAGAKHPVETQAFLVQAGLSDCTHYAQETVSK